MDSSPGILTDNGQYEYKADAKTQSLNEMLNSRETVDTVPITRLGNRLQSGISDTDYGMGYKQVFVGNQVDILSFDYEAPDLPVSQLPFKESLYKSTLRIDQGGQKVLTKSLRSPGINEGY